VFSNNAICKFERRISLEKEKNIIVTCLGSFIIANKYNNLVKMGAENSLSIISQVSLVPSVTLYIVLSFGRLDWWESSL